MIKQGHIQYGFSICKYVKNTPTNMIDWLMLLFGCIIPQKKWYMYTKDHDKYSW